MTICAASQLPLSKEGWTRMKESNRSTRDKVLDGIRVFNKHIFNRIILTFAEGSRGPFSVVYHKGRRSGRIYRTPVLASHVGEAILIPLSYGDHVDWLKNILEQGGCEVVRKRRKITASDPQVIDAPTALSLLPENRRRLYERFEVEKFVRLKKQIDE
jgi:deazaflavin-dependent oxidoreductase (nitroreductase family)